MKRVPGDQLLEHGAIVSRKPGILKRRRQKFGAAAVSLVQTQNVEARFERHLRNPEHVRRFAGTVEPVNQHQRGMLPGDALPVTFREKPRLGFHLEEALLDV